MKRIFLVLVGIMTIPVTVLARGDSGHLGGVTLAGSYGMAYVNPPDINGLSSVIPSTPKANNLTADTIYGGSLGFLIGQRWDIKFMYDQQDAKNYANTNLSPNTGFEIQEDNVWGMLDLYLIHSHGAYVTLGAGAGYPTYFHVIEQTATTTQFNAAYNIGYIGQATIGIMFGSHLSIFFDGGYQKLTSGNITNTAGVNLTNTSGANAVADLSGFRADAGLALHF